MTKRTCRSTACGRVLLACAIVAGAATPVGSAQSPAIPQPDPAPVPEPKPPASPPPAAITSVQTPPPPVTQAKPPKRKPAKKPPQERVVLAQMHAPDPGPALVSASRSAGEVVESVPPAISAFPAAASSSEAFPFMPVLAVLAALGVILVSLAAIPAWALARISGSLARQRIDMAFLGFVLLAALAAAFLLVSP